MVHFSWRLFLHQLQSSILLYLHKFDHSSPLSVPHFSCHCQLVYRNDLSVKGIFVSRPEPMLCQLSKNVAAGAIFAEPEQHRPEPFWNTSTGEGLLNVSIVSQAFVTCSSVMLTADNDTILNGRRS